MKGGNSDELYQGDGRLRMAESLRDQHPDIVTITRKWNRWQHHVDYRLFQRNRLVMKPDAVVGDGPDNFGMELQIDYDAVADDDQQPEAAIDQLSALSVE